MGASEPANIETWRNSRTKRVRPCEEIVEVYDGVGIDDLHRQNCRAGDARVRTPVKASIGIDLRMRGVQRSVSDFKVRRGRTPCQERGKIERRVIGAGGEVPA